MKEYKKIEYGLIRAIINALMHKIEILFILLLKMCLFKKATNKKTKDLKALILKFKAVR
ncbi:hypothetical protein V2E26_00990 [Metamycoplasma gateae]|uniref:Uncharacterized protein n=1 Tax=Metamycoplasma gateae TaxID=35769 RepID=A0ABZ2AI45_9BACT|nr:hypothetical protein V2E26_00990 [Metamycoplasma gateae]